MGTRSTWPEVKENIQDGGSLFSKDDPSGKEGDSKLYLWPYISIVILSKTVTTIAKNYFGASYS